MDFSIVNAIHSAFANSKAGTKAGAFVIAMAGAIAVSNLVGPVW